MGRPSVRQIRGDTVVFTATDEQMAALHAYKTGENIIIKAGAGTGKTSTLQLLAHDQPQRRGLYLAFNKSIATEAAKKFQGTGVTSRTVHSLAYRDFGRPFQERLNGRYQFWTVKSEILGIRERFDLGEGVKPRYMSRQTIVRLVMETVDAFCKSAALEITATLVPVPEGLAFTDGPAGAALHMQEFIASYARKAWDDLSAPAGQISYKHDYYLKRWQMSGPDLQTDFVLFDEAQDADEIMTDVVRKQTNTQVVAVGDENQGIYGWRGAVNSMNAFGGVRTHLTQSFRFGQAIADEANFWLDKLGSDMRLRGMPGAASSVWKSERQPEAILTRTNMGAIRAVIDSQERDVKVGIAGTTKAKELLSLGKAAMELRDKGHTNHRDLDFFNSWQEVVDFANEDDGGDIAALVKVIDDYGPERIIEAVEATVPVEQARTVVSTMHVAKGLEFFHVKIGPDFYEPGKDDDGQQKPLTRAEARLLYVGVTRAQRHLDPHHIDWAKTFEGGITD
ncbi:DNA helicase [Rathayibacter rathayi]|uniref:DNA helicase n=1 Tax=Rathayibacter rathayi TaxID=33887 RepID=A0ABX5AEX8_RATRA|nr:DNA helicase [Rathayibacter rathayi]PPF51624.1 DNA helicase [Rathayibacter rathayi]PPF83214.1 DNA helicase [Rathayibacter rathayi]PPG47045.1 DNA helicase [Rathayibacter rathayi]PPG94068.1 DNA helicase [Rathayibacter rathayi]